MHFCGMEGKRGQMSSTRSLGLASDICLFKMVFYFGIPPHHPRNRTLGVPSVVDEVECHVRKCSGDRWEGLENSHTCVWQQGQIP